MFYIPCQIPHYFPHQLAAICFGLLLYTLPIKRRHLKDVSELWFPKLVYKLIGPHSCLAPPLDERGQAVSKTVGSRLRAIHSEDKDLLASLCSYSGFLQARGYEMKPVIYNLCCMANRDRSKLIRWHYKPPPRMVVPLITPLHPAMLASPP